MTESILDQNITFSEAELQSIDRLLDERSISKTYILTAFREGIRFGLMRAEAENAATTEALQK